MGRRARGAALVVGLVAAPSIAVAQRNHPTPELCTIHTVQAGESMTGIAIAAGRMPWDVAPLNPHIANPDLIYPGDQIAVDCTPRVEVAPEVPALVPESMPAALSVPLPPIVPTLQAYERDGVLTDEGIVATYFDAGFRGNALVTMSAITICESGGRPGAVGDVHLQSEKWNASIGLAQIRSLNAEAGTGSTRDGEQLHDPAFNAASAFAISSGGSNFQPWTCFTNGMWEGHVERMRAAAGALGLLEG